MRNIRVVCRRSACTGHCCINCVRQFRATSMHVCGGILFGGNNPNALLFRCQHPPFHWLCILLCKKPFHKILNVRCVSTMASRMDHFVGDENWFVLCGTDFRGRVSVVSQWIWIPLHINGICEQWRQARGCGEPNEGSRSFLRIVTRPVWRD